MPRIVDAHIHFADDAPQFLSLLDELDLHLLNICFAADYDDDWRAQRSLYSRMRERHPSHFSWVTSFDLPQPEDGNSTAYVDEVLASLDMDFDRGAAGCKIWKNVGMSLRKAGGSFLMIDDPLFAPIFEYLAQKDQTLLMHMAEPLACWQPLDERSPHFDYYRSHPQWHMYNRRDFPSHGELIAARDRVVERNPDLRIIGAHLASLEYDVDEVASRLERYPNLAVDISARLGDLALQDSEKVADFFTRYQDQILFGTDVVMHTRPSELPEQECRAAIQQLRDIYELHFAYLETAQQLQVKNISTVGLQLAPAVLNKIYHTNAMRWYPSLAAVERPPS